MLPLAALSTLLAVAFSFESANAHDHHIHHRRQNPPNTTPTPTTTPLPGTSDTSSQSTPAAGPNSYQVPPLSEITPGLTHPFPTLATTYTPGASPPVSGAPPLPSAFVYVEADWPALDVIPPVDTPQVQEWMKVLEGLNIPDITPTNGSECIDSPVAKAEAEERAWWTCGGWTEKDDITTCPEKFTWGVSFDDGPAPFSEPLLDFLKEKNMKATFFDVGSRCVSYPEILRAEFMEGHEICVHTWSHHALTNMSNQQIVAELGWTKRAIQQIIGVTPKCMRPPFGDVDKRVRAIARAMGFVDILWTRNSVVTFDTNDWRVPGGEITAPEQLATFEGLLGNASLLDTGFIVLQHDLYLETVDLAIGYTLETALKHDPPFKLESIGKCQGWEAAELYNETAKLNIIGGNSSTGSSNSSGPGPNGSNSSTGAAGEGGAAGLLVPLSTLVAVVAGAMLAFVGGAM